MGPAFNAACVVRERGAEPQIRPTKPRQRSEEQDIEGKTRKESQEEEEEGLSYQLRLAQHWD